LFGDCEQQQLKAYLIFDAVAESYSCLSKKSGVTLVLPIVYLAENSNLAVYIAYDYYYPSKQFALTALAIVLLLESQKVG
jgi:hypothetical protein